MNWSHLGCWCISPKKYKALEGKKRMKPLMVTEETG